MNKAIMLSIRPQHLLNILNGDKTLELRKTVPRDFKGWVYLYCTKAKPYLFNMYNRYTLTNSKKDLFNILNGKIVARFWFDEYKIVGGYGEGAYSVDNKHLEDLCLTFWDVYNYGLGKTLYAWHIKNLEIFDKPLNLSDFNLTRAPQNWQYIYEKEELK